MIDPQASVSVLDYWRVAWRARWWILAITVLTAAAALGATRYQTKVYTTKATMLPPKEAGPQAVSMSLGSLLGAPGGREGAGGIAPGLTIGLPSTSTTQDMYVALLKSRTLREGVVADLAKRWGPGVGDRIVSTEPDARQKGVITVTAEADDPKLVADVANTYLAELDRLLERFADQSSRHQQGFLRGQLERTAREVQNAEAALLKFQTENRYLVAQTDPNAKQGIDQVANLRGTIMGLEMQREVMRLKFTDEHSQVREIEKQIAELKSQYSKNLFGGAMDLPSEGTNARARKEFFVAAEKMTPLQFEYLKLYRNLKIQEAFYTAAQQGLQQIKYNDGLTTPRVDVLDPALPPGGPTRPRVLLIVAVAALTALIGSILLAYLLDYLARVRSLERHLRLSHTLTHVTNGHEFPARAGGAAGAAEPASAPEPVAARDPQGQQTPPR